MAEDGQGLEGIRTDSDYSGSQDSGLLAICAIATHCHRRLSFPGHVIQQLALTSPADEDDLLLAADVLALEARVMTTQRLSRCPLPAIVCLADGTYGLLAGRDEVGDYLLIDPPSQVALSIAENELLRLTRGRVIVVQPRRAGVSGESLSRSGLRGLRAILWRYRVVIGHVIIISLLVPTFALATSLFSLEVLDRMLAHHRYEALVVLVLGLVGLKARR